MNSFEWFIGRRYLFSKERNALISVNTIISMIGVAVGVAALVVVIGVMDGAYNLLMNKITGITPHVMLRPLGGADEAFDQTVLERARALPEVTRAEAILQRPAFIQAEDGAEAQKQGVQVVGQRVVGPDSIFNIELPPDTPPIHLNPGEVALGAPLARTLKVEAGDTVQVLAQNQVRSSADAPYVSARLRVVGTFETGYYEFDDYTAFIAPESYQSLFRPAGVDLVYIRLTDPELADTVKDRLLIAGYETTTWKDESAEFFTSLLIQKYGLFVILLLIVLVAAFNIIGTLILMVTEKTREIGILRAVGASEWRVAKIFWINGILIGLVGAGGGLALGVVMALAVPYVPLNMPESIYNFERLPVEIRPATLLMIFVATMLICTAASILPARQAARLHPSVALRYD